MPEYSIPPYLPPKPLPSRKPKNEIPGVDWKSVDEQLKNIEYLMDLVGSGKQGRDKAKEAGKKLPELRKQMFKLRRFMENSQEETPERYAQMDEKTYWEKWGDRYLASIEME